MKKFTLFLITVFGGVNSYSQFSIPYMYGDDSWKNEKSYSDRVKALQIPQDSLSTIPTLDLMEACLNYPYLMNIFIYNDTRVGFREIFSNYNGFQELFNRKDLYSIILDKVKDVKLDTTEWESGVYAFRAKIGDTVVTQKMVIGKNKN